MEKSREICRRDGQGVLLLRTFPEGSSERRYTLVDVMRRREDDEQIKNDNNNGEE